MSSSPQQILEFERIITQLRLIERFKGQTYWRDYPQQQRWESVADHSWRVAMLVILFADHLSQPFDVQRALKIALIHDVPEIIAGDASPLGKSGTGADSHAFNDNIKAQRHADEDAAAKAIFAKLDPSDAEHLYDLWLEIESQETFESRIVKALDRLDAVTQVLEMQDGHLYPKHQEFNLSYGLKGSNVDHAIKAYADLIAAELKSRYSEFKPSR